MLMILLSQEIMMQTFLFEEAFEAKV